MNPVDELLVGKAEQVRDDNGCSVQQLKINPVDKLMSDKLVIDKLIVDRVKQIQQSNGYSDQRMADFIGCTRTTYNLTKTGRKPAGGDFYRGAILLSWSLWLENKKNNGDRLSVIKRKTKETDIRLELNVDGSGKSDINNGIKMFDHLLSQVARHGAFDIKLTATGDDQHHLVEDVAICLGQAFGKALGEKRGIVRMANVLVPMDDALATVALDISGRGYTKLQISFAENDMFGFSTDLIRHFLESFAFEARLNLYATVDGVNDHHKAEALFKALGRALDTATRIDERLGGELPSTKDLLEG